MQIKPVRYDFKRAKIQRARCGAKELTSFHMREVNGQDEEQAANMAKSKGGSATSAEEMIRLAIVAVNDQPVAYPYIEFDLWNSRARAFALKAFNDLNGMTNQEADSLMATAEETDAPLSSLPAVASANG